MFMCKRSRSLLYAHLGLLLRHSRIVLRMATSPRGWPVVHETGHLVHRAGRKSMRLANERWLDNYSKGLAVSPAVQATVWRLYIPTWAMVIAQNCGGVSSTGNVFGAGLRRRQNPPEMPEAECVVARPSRHCLRSVPHASLINKGE